jgi:hypothetical protein
MSHLASVRRVGDLGDFVTGLLLEKLSRHLADATDLQAVPHEWAAGFEPSRDDNWTS